MCIRDRTCAEALSAGLYISGYRDAAELLMNKFKWGHGFITLNREVLESYVACETGAEVIETQNRWLTEGGPKRGVSAPRDFPESSESDEDESSGSEDDGVPSLEPNRNKTHNRIGGESRRSAFPSREMPPSSEDETESETESDGEDAPGGDLAERVAAVSVREGEAGH